MSPETPSDEVQLSRRSFLTWATVGLGSLIASALGGAGAGYFLSPTFKTEEEGWVDAGSAKSMPLGTPVKIEFVARQRDAWATSEKRSAAWVLTPNGRDFAVYDPRCTHLGCPYRWDEPRRQFLCPCHAAVFGIDGQVVSGPAPRPLDRYAVKIVSGRLLIRPQAQASPA